MRNKLLLVLSLILLALVLASLFSPFFVARAVALWLGYEARRSDLTLTTGAIRAPFLRSVEIRDLHIIRTGRTGVHFELTAPRVEAAFRLAALLRRSDRWHLLGSLRIEHARLAVLGRGRESAGSIDWAALNALLPEQFDLSADEILLQQPLGRVQMHDAHISGYNNRSGGLGIGSLELQGLYFQKTLADLHGITRWQDGRLSIGSLHLLAGIEFDSLAFDLTRLRAARIGAEAALSIFNGNMRANFATERPGKTRLWEAAVSASGVSLSQLAPAMGLTEPLQGLLQASKFSFRGDPRDLIHATASLWMELTGFSWRERTADVIMVGANFYERSIQLQEFYIKQHENELTLSGESALSPDWLNPDFRGDVSGSIDDLGQFAELFGAPAGAFEGKVAVRGRVHAHERRVDGNVALTGDALKLFRNPVDSLTARMTLDSPRVHLDQFEIRRGEDFIRGSGQIDFVREKKFQLSAESWCHDLAQCHVRVPLLGSPDGSFFAQVDASGDENASTASIAAQTDEAKVSARGTVRGTSSASIDSLTLSMNGVSAAFTGTVDFGDAKNLTLLPRDELHLAEELRENVCVERIELHQGDSGMALSQLAMTQHQLALETASPSSKQTLPLCSDSAAEEGQPLRVNVPSSAPSPTATPLPSPAP